MATETIVLRVFNGGGAEFLAKFRYVEHAREFCANWHNESRFDYIVLYDSDTGHCEATLNERH